MKEKAEELIDMFTYSTTADDYRNGYKSAIKCVDEIMKVTNDPFWTGVKEEIIKEQNL